MKDERFYSRNLCFVVFPSGDGFRRRKDFRKLTRKDELVKNKIRFDADEPPREIQLGGTKLRLMKPRRSESGVPGLDGANL